MEFSRPGHWSGSPFPSPGDLSNPEIEPRSPILQAGSLPAEPAGKSSIYLTTYLFAHLSPNYVSVSLSMKIPIYLVYQVDTYLPYLTTYLATSLPTYLSIYLIAYLPTHPPTCLIYLAVYLSTYLPTIYLPVHHLSVFLCVSISVSLPL